MNDHNLNIRVSKKTLELVKAKARHSGISQSKLVTIAVELIDENQVLQYLLDRIDPKKELQ